MGLRERSYSILLVSASEKTNKNLIDLLPSSEYDSINTVHNVNTAKRLIADRDFDFIIVNSPLPDDDGMRFSIDASSRKNTVVLLMVKADIYDETLDTCADFGVFLISKPLSVSTMEMALDWLKSARERLRQTEKKVLSIEEKMAEIRIVNRAKWLLISELKMSEQDAHRYIEKQAMDRCVSRRQIAEEIIKPYG
ncbi:MAG: ANTAR domain-containing protein [Clostridia bacterium]|nr:ANTAR domain-containing protein [Clostridia bacterium]